jgi:hypothetical protein
MAVAREVCFERCDFFTVWRSNFVGGAIERTDDFRRRPWRPAGGYMPEAA